MVGEPRLRTASLPRYSYPELRKGRPQRLPVDTSPMGSGSIDAQARLAWLLATSRLLNPDPGVALRSTFMETLRAHGTVVDPSRISRWESGQLSIPVPAVMAYADAAGLDQGWILALMRVLSRNADTRSRPLESAAYASIEVSTRTLEDLLQRAADDAGPGLRGEEWLRLAIGLTRFEFVFLREVVWASICGRLISEMARTSGSALAQRYEAATTLLCSSIAKGPLLRAIGGWLTTPAVQLPNTGLMLLREIDDPAASDLAFRFLRDENRLLREAAVPVVAVKAARGHLSQTAEEQLEALCLRQLRSGVDHRTQRATFGLVSSLPDASVERVSAGLRDRLRCF